VLIVAEAGLLRAETVDVEFRGDIDLEFFQCTDIAPGGRIRRVCYDGANRYLVIKRDETWRHYCEVEAGTAARFIASPAIERFYGSVIENRHDCRPATVPKYE
jgi:hypothetical protein